MLTKRSGRATTNRRANAAQPKKEAKQAVHVVFTATMELATMKRSDQRVIGIYDALDKAEELEQKFNAAAQEDNGTITKAYVIRYGLPYTAPIIKQMLGS